MDGTDSHRINYLHGKLNQIFYGDMRLSEEKQIEYLEKILQLKKDMAVCDS